MAKRKTTSKQVAKKEEPKPLIQRPPVTQLKSRAHKVKFLEGFAMCGTVTGAAEYAGCSRGSYYAWTNPASYGGKYFDEEFVAAMDEAASMYEDMIRAEWDRRAIEGVEKPIFGSTGFGEERETGIVGHVTEYSDRLLELRIKTTLAEGKALRPQVNVDARSQTAIANVNGKPADAQEVKKLFNPEQMSKDTRDKMRQFLQSAEQDAIEGEFVEQ